MEKPHDQTTEKAKQHKVATASAVLADGALVEMVRTREGRCRFVCDRGDGWRFEERIHVTPFRMLVPYSAENNLIKHDVVLFPSAPEEYETEEQLLFEIEA